MFLIPLSLATCAALLAVKFFFPRADLLLILIGAAIAVSLLLYPFLWAVVGWCGILFSYYGAQYILNSK